MQDLKLTFPYLSGFEIRDKEVLRKDLSKAGHGNYIRESFTTLYELFRRQTILPTEGVERRERRVGGLGLSFCQLLVCL